MDELKHGSENKNTLLVSHICFDNCGGIERSSSRGCGCANAIPSKFCPLCQKQVIASALERL